MKKKRHESAVLTYSPPESIGAREELFGLLQDYPATPDERERCLGLFLRGSSLARILAVGDLYRLIVDRPGSILDIGTWRGLTAVLCENFRAIHEPLNFNRRVICFDTFEGYTGFGKGDGKTHEIVRKGKYATGREYAAYLAHLLELHERNNAMGHNTGKHRVIAGDVRKTLPAFFSGSPNECVALAFFDVNAYEPTKEAFDHVWQRVVPGGVVAFWQLTRSTLPAEGRVYCEHILNRHPHTLHRSTTYPGLAYLVRP